MHLQLVLLVTNALVVSCAHAPSLRDGILSRFHQRRALTTDNTCGIIGAGNGKNYSCNPSLAQGGPCCSQNGYCGKTTDYCGAGCQATYGLCGDSAVGVSDPNLCGVSNNNNKCANSLCCGSDGKCSNSTSSCSTGCQSEFGRCTPVKANGQCGPQGNGAKCSSGCCSAAGWCGTGSDYCSDPDCQWRYGTCDSNTTPAGASTLSDTRPLVGRVSYTDDLYDCSQDNVVALTFDDGPYSYTGDLLDILKSYNFTATFFITGNNLGKGPIDTTAPYPSLIKRMIAEGHQVASHTWSHYNLSDIGTDMRMQQMAKNERAIANIIGKYPTYMRPPFSECSQQSGCWADLQKLGYHRTYFDLDTQDYLNPLPSQIQNSKNIVKNYLAASGVTDYLSIQHDIVEQSVHNLTTYYYDAIKAKGWKGVTVGECVGDPKVNWYRTPGGSLSTSAASSGGTAKAASSEASATSAGTITGKVSSSQASAMSASTASQASSSVSKTVTHWTRTDGLIIWAFVTPGWTPTDALPAGATRPLLTKSQY